LKEEQPEEKECPECYEIGKPVIVGEHRRMACAFCGLLIKEALIITIIDESALLEFPEKFRKLFAGLKFIAEPEEEEDQQRLLVYKDLVIESLENVSVIAALWFSVSFKTEEYVPFPKSAAGIPEHIIIRDPETHLEVPSLN